MFPLVILVNFKRINEENKRTWCESIISAHFVHRTTGLSSRMHCACDIFDYFHTLTWTVLSMWVCERSQIRHMTITHFCSHQGSGYGHFVQINLDRRIEMSRTAGHYLLHNSFSSCARTILGPTTVHCVAIIDAFIVSCAPKAKAINNFDAQNEK